MKKQYEKEIFKLLGEYALFDPSSSPPIKYISANKCAEYFKNKTVTISYTIEKQSKKGTKFETFENSKTYYDIWSTDPNMKEYKGVTFNCDESKVPKSIFNLFSGFRHFEEYNAKKVNLSVIHDHIRSLVNYVEDDYTYLMSWLAHIVQKPYELPQVIMVIISEEGTGKDIFAEFISKVIGEQYYINTDKLETICGKFNSTLGGKLLLVCTETDPTESRQRTESIKFISTAKSVPIEAKGKDPVKTNLYGRLIMFSNRLLAFPIESGSRRPKIMQSSTKYLKATMGDAGNAKYLTKLATQYYENKNYQKAFLDYLMDYDISEWKSSVITKSALHQQLEENSVPMLAKFLETIVQENIDQIEYKISTTKLLKNFNAYSNEQNYTFDYAQKKFNIEMENTYGAKNKRLVQTFTF